MKPLVSIIVTTYNVESYINECLNSIINQTIKNIEIIIVDDGSTDQTIQIIEKFKKKDSRIKLIAMNNNSIGGVATAANIGIENATGIFIGFADGDDIYDVTMFEKLYTSATTQKADISLCSFSDFISENMEKITPFDNNWHKLSKNLSFDISHYENKKEMLQLSPAPWRKLYNRELLKKNNLRFNECPYFFEDNFFHWLVILNSNKVAFVNETLCFHRVNRIGQTMNSNGEKLLGVFYQHKLIYDYINHNNLLSLYKENTLKWLIDHISWISSTIDCKYLDSFYNIINIELKKYKKSFIKKILKEYKRDIRLVNIVNSVSNNNKNTFIKSVNRESVMNKTNLLNRFLNSYKKRGFTGILKKLTPQIKKNDIQKINEIEKLMKIGFIHIEDKVEKAIIQNNELITKINEIEKLIKIGFIHIENKVEKDNVI